MAGNKTLPNRREEAVLNILLARERYGREIRDMYEERTGESMPVGSLYTTLDRMEEQGLIRSRLGESTSERGGNRRKYYKIVSGGISSLNDLRERANMLAAKVKGSVANGQ